MGLLRGHFVKDTKDTTKLFVGTLATPDASRSNPAITMPAPPDFPSLSRAAAASGGSQNTQNKIINGTLGDDFIFGGDGPDVINGWGGNDTLHGGNGNDVIDGGIGSDTLYGNEGDDTLSGGDGRDRVYGGAGNDVLIGGDGVDTLDGGSGIDRVSYEFHSSRVFVNLNIGDASGEDGAHDSLTDIEDVTGSGRDDMIFGDAKVNRLYGLSGDDILSGGGGADILDGGAGNDFILYFDSSAGVTVNLVSGRGYGGNAQGDIIYNVEKIGGSGYNDSLIGNEGANSLFGYDGDDLLTGNAGADIIDGGRGNDTVSYSCSLSGVRVDLALNEGSFGDAQGDDIFDIENVIGTNSGDTVLGDDASNILIGMNGDDSLSGGGARDELYGGAGRDYLEGGEGKDIIDGGSGLDLVTYFSSPEGVTINLAFGATSGGDANGDRVANIEGVIGSTFGDTLIGDGGANELYGWHGDDRLIGGAGADKMDGGGGTDALDYRSSTSGIRVELASGMGFGGDAEGDRIYNVEIVTGSNLNDILSGDSSTNILIGSRGDDALYGGLGADVLIGGAGADMLDGGYGADILVGGENNIGGFGNDIITLIDGTVSGTSSGDGGKDTFIIAGYDRMGDRTIILNTSLYFVKGEDRIDISDLRDLSGNIIDLADIVSATTDLGSSVSIDLSRFKTEKGFAVSGSLTISGINDPSGFSASDFVFTNGVNWESQLFSTPSSDWG